MAASEVFGYSTHNKLVLNAGFSGVASEIGLVAGDQDDANAERMRGNEAVHGVAAAVPHGSGQHAEWRAA